MLEIQGFRRFSRKSKKILHGTYPRYPQYPQWRLWIIQPISILKKCINGDLLITMGAGDIVKVGENLLSK